MDHLYQKAVASKRAVDIQAFKDAFTSRFTPANVLRFLHTSTFFGQPISNIPQIRPTVVSSSTPLIHRRQHQVLASKAEFRAGPFGPPAQRLGYNAAVRVVREQLYFASVFPMAAALINNDKLNVEDAFLRAEIVKLEDRAAVEDIPEVAENWRRVVDGNSPKLQAILQDIKAMVDSVRPAAPPVAGPQARSRSRLPQPPRGAASSRPAGRTAGGAHQRAGGSPRSTASSRAAPPRGEATRFSKMVIITPTVATAVYLWMFLSQEKFKAAHGPAPVLIHQDLSLADRDRIVRRFSSETAAYTNILIGTFDTIGTAANLQRANYQILTSPLPRAREVTQAFGRTNRTGQKLVCVHKILTLEENPVDRANLCMIADTTVTSNVFNMSERLQTADLSGKWNAEA